MIVRSSKFGGLFDEYWAGALRPRGLSLHMDTFLHMNDTARPKNLIMLKSAACIRADLRTIYHWLRSCPTPCAHVITPENILLD